MIEIYSDGRFSVDAEKTENGTNLHISGDNGGSKFKVDLADWLKLEKEVKGLNYDSEADTLAHIRRVNELMGGCAQELIQRGIDHDKSKFSLEEKLTFDTFTPMLRQMDYGSEEYFECLKSMKPALDHHYANNSHHPEHYERGINDMDLFDVIEMLMDWKAASERHDSGDIFKSIVQNRDRFGLSNQLQMILENTAVKMGWMEQYPEASAVIESDL